VTRHGEQKGAKKRYTSSNNFLAFLEETLSKFKNKTVILIRLDSGFFQFNILDYLEQKETGQSALDQIQLNPDSALEIYYIYILLQNQELTPIFKIERQK
jgi:hypothetical protein